MVRNMRRIICFLALISFSSQYCCAFADIVVVNNTVYQGSIVDVSKDNMLFMAHERHEKCVLSFHRKNIKAIVLKTFQFPPQTILIKFFFFTIPVSMEAFDRLIVEDGSCFAGSVEIETGQAVYLSLLLEKGMGIVEFEKNEIVGILGAVGWRRLLGRLYFKFKYFVYDVRYLFRRMFERRNASTIQGKSIAEWKTSLKQEEAGRNIGKRRMFTPETLKAFLGGYYSLAEKDRYDQAVKNGYLLLGMPKKDVNSVMGLKRSEEFRDGKERWSYPDGMELVLYRNRLVGYTKNSREKILHKIFKYYAELVSTREALGPLLKNATMGRTEQLGSGLDS